MCCAHHPVPSSIKNVSSTPQSSSVPDKGVRSRSLREQFPSSVFLDQNSVAWLKYEGNSLSMQFLLSFIFSFHCFISRCQPSPHSWQSVKPVILEYFSNIFHRRLLNPEILFIWAIYLNSGWVLWLLFVNGFKRRELIRATG